MDYPFDEQELHLAHVTPVRAFKAALGPEGVVESFRDDNLVMLCEFCHAIQTDMDAIASGDLHPRRAIRGLGKLSAEFLDGAEPGAEAAGSQRSAAWYVKRQELVTSLFHSIKAERGWIKVEELGLGPVSPPRKQTRGEEWF